MSERTRTRDTSNQSDWAIAFDTGGTFTDFALQDRRSGRFIFGKVPSTNSNPSEAVLMGLAEMLHKGKIGPSDLTALFHATTVATNLILERRGGRIALVTTRGFRDILLIGRQKRYETYNLSQAKPEQLVRRRDILEIQERIGADGKVIEPPAEESLAEAIAALAAGSYDGVAIAFLNAYANHDHERYVADRIAAALPGILVSVSCDISPQIREFERCSTAVADAYVKGRVNRYLANLADALRAQSIDREFMVMQSNGGLVSPELARRFPVRIVESGPAAGVLMCREFAASLGETNVLTFDMGGTTAKLGAIDDGRPAVTPQFEVDQVGFRRGSGLPLNISAIELLEIGAGGGSIAGVRMGTITVGPQSAGAQPGPICYSRGGTEPTITDANAALGYINPDFFNGGAMRLDLQAAREGIERLIAAPLGLDVTSAAWGIHAMANASMERAMRMVSIEKGRDPRDYVVMGFGGAGPLHVCRLARALQVPRVIIPHGAGVGSALGLLAAETCLDASLTRVTPLEGDVTAVAQAIFAALEARLRKELLLLRQSIEPRWARSAYLRYAGQGYELPVLFPDGTIDEHFLAEIRPRFEASYAQIYGNYRHGTAIEIVDWRLEMVIPRRDVVARSTFDRSASSRHPTGAVRRAWFPETGFVDVPTLDRAGLFATGPLKGPAIIEDDECTIVVTPDDDVSMTEFGDVVVSITSAKGWAQ